MDKCRFSVYKIKFKYLLVAAFISTLIISSLMIDKAFIINMFMVESDVTGAPDLIVVLEGGSVKFSPTRERADTAIELYKQYPCKVLVCAYRIHKKAIINYLVLNGISTNDFSKTLYDYDEKDRSGTYNNVLEIISVIKNNHDIKKIVIVTSPYHELRVHLILSILFEENEIDELVKVEFSHINDSEVIYTDMPRFIRMISHELMGITGFYVGQIKSELVTFFRKGVHS